MFFDVVVVFAATRQNKLFILYIIQCLFFGITTNFDKNLVKLMKQPYIIYYVVSYEKKVPPEPFGPMYASDFFQPYIAQAKQSAQHC